MLRVPTARVLATKDGLELMLGLLFAQGAMCPRCGFGTRVTSKRWAKCKRCGERVERRALESIKAATTPLASPPPRDTLPGR
jgi:tRNA(Ile2) C34 agmatinyltransferase TiaS